MRIILIAAALIGLSAGPLAAQEAFSGPTLGSPAPAAKSWRERAYDAATAVKDAASSRVRAAVSEGAIAGYKVALKLNAEQEKLWPAAAAALRGLARAKTIDEAAMGQARAGIAPLIASLDDVQRQKAAQMAQKAGLSQYASAF
jgi:hypothetical protein